MYDCSLGQVAVVGVFAEYQFNQTFALSKHTPTHTETTVWTRYESRDADW